MASGSFGTVIVDALNTILAAAIAWLSAAFGMWIRTGIKNKKASWALDKVARLTIVVVKDLQQTMAGEIRSAAADGKITHDEAQSLKTAAITRLKAMLGPEGITELMSALSLDPAGLESLLRSHIEASVLDVKRADK